MKKQPGIKDVAKAAGVSTASVSQTFKNPKRVSEEVREKVKKAAMQIGYIPKNIKKRKQFGKIGILIDKLRSPFGEFYGPIILGAIDYARRINWNISLETYNSRVSFKVPNMVEQNQVDGVILLSKHADQFIKKFKDTEVPFCVVDYKSENVLHNYVISDWKKGAYLAAKHLISMGHRKIAMIHAPLDKGQASLDRVEGFNMALEKDDIILPTGYMQNGKFSYMEAYKVCKTLLDLNPRPTAIFCATDVMALGAYKAIKERGLKVGDDVSVVGFDGIELPYYMDPIDPPLTTVLINKEKMGIAAVNVIDDQITAGNNHGHQIVLDVKLINRDSVKKIG